MSRPSWEAEHYQAQARDTYAAEWSSAYGAAFVARLATDKSDAAAAKVANGVADRAVVALARLNGDEALPPRRETPDDRAQRLSRYRQR